MLRIAKSIIAVWCVLATGALCADASEVRVINEADAQKCLSRVIPLPKEAEFRGFVRLPAGRIALIGPSIDSPALETASKLLGALALAGAQDASFTIRIALVRDDSSESSDRLRTRLPALPNPGQAYAIIPFDNARGLLLLANTDIGLLYAARTLVQMIGSPKAVGQETELEVPLVTVTDWPDLAERGQWGGNAVSDLPWTSQWKLNTLEHGRVDAALIRQGMELGVKVVPFISHLEQLPVPAELKSRQDVVRVPDPSKPLPSDYKPGLCMSSPDTHRLISTWLEERATLEGVTDVMVWLSEDAAPCFCEKCIGKEPFGLELACILGAFAEVKARHPDVRLRLLTSQGSFPVNDRILAAVPEDVGVTYYDGGRTYDSSRKPMIYPLLEDYARMGRWLGVYPQVTHSWRTVFPWTGPQFIRSRAQEFVEKKLKCMIGYAVPSNRFHEFNIMAMAEWTWNSRGRSPEEFCRVYAAVMGIRDPEAFAKWAVKAGEAGWALAESKLMLSLIYDPTAGLRGNVPFDHRFQAARISNIEEAGAAIAEARGSLELARQAGDPRMINESECVLAGLESFDALRAMSAVLLAPSMREQDKQALSDSLGRLDTCARTIRAGILEFGNRVCGKDQEIPTRLLDTAFVLLRTCDAVREMASARGVPDPLPECRLRKLGGWSAEDFAGGERATLEFDLKDIVPAAGGSYQVGFDFVDSAYGASVEKLTVRRKGGASEAVVAETPDALKRVSRWERWCEMRVGIPEREVGDGLLLEVRLRGLPADAPGDRRTCSGSVGIRRVLENRDMARRGYK